MSSCLNNKEIDSISENVFKDVYLRCSVCLNLSKLLIAPCSVVRQHLDIYGCVSVSVVNLLLWDL